MHAGSRATAAVVAIGSLILLTAGPAPARSLDIDGACPPITAGADCTGVDVSGESYADAVLDGVTLRAANLTGSDFSGAVLDDSVLDGVTASMADFTDSSLLDTSLVGGSFPGADFTDADLTEARATGADFTRAKLRNADLEHFDAPNAVFARAVASAADFVNASLTDADFREANITDADFTLADLSHAKLAGAILNGADLGSATLSGADLTETDLTGADLTHADLTGAIWRNTTCPDGRIVTGAPCGEDRVKSESGFINVPSFQPTIMKALLPVQLTTVEANLWYSYFAADTDPANAPLFVMQNGGPGAATMVNLFANNTAPYTLNLDEIRGRATGADATFVPNPNSWTQMGNVLYIDPALTGFSYNISDRAANSSDDEGAFAARLVQMGDGQTLNPWVDADQVLRSVLTFLDGHPALANNPVVFVGESYGGIRVTTMLNMLLNNRRYMDHTIWWPYSDPGLVQQIATHFNGPGARGPVDRSRVLQQFGRQVLIQPQLSSYQAEIQGDMYYGPNSVIDTLAAQLDGPPFSRNPGYCPKNFEEKSACVTLYWVPQIYGRDQYAYNRPATFTDDQEIYAIKQMNNAGTLNVLLGSNVAKIKGFTPKDRDGLAYHSLWRGIESTSDPNAGVAPESEITLLDMTPGTSLVDDTLAGASIDDVIRRLLRMADFDPDKLRYSRQTGPGTLTDVLGPLYSADEYFMAFNMIEWVFYDQATPLVMWPAKVSADKNPIFGDMFVDNARYVNTFLTDAKYDLVIFSPALPKALAKHDGVKRVTATSGEGTADELGQFQITYDDGTIARLYYPFYGRAGHAVAATQPDKIRKDVGTWLTLDLQQ